jgi:hypothetical protein
MYTSIYPKGIPSVYEREHRTRLVPDELQPMKMTEEDLIEEVGRRLTVAAPGADIILFGSRAYGSVEQRP